MAKHLKPEEKQYILKRYQQGAPLRAISREIKRPDITVRRTLEALGVDLGPPKTSNKRTSPETEALVVRLYDEGRTWKEIMAEAHVTDVTAGKILQRNGREYNRKPEGAAGKADVIAALAESGHSAREIGRMLGHSKSTICNITADEGAELPKLQGCEYPDYFEQIDTPEKAYWLGFLTADGCMHPTAAYPEGAYLTIDLSITDADHLVKLKEAIGASRNVRKAVKRSGERLQGYASLAIGSHRLAEPLIALGITPRKSATVEPWDGPEHLMPHYWRGLFDGDGSLAYKGPGLHTAFLCGSEACVRAFLAWAQEICGTKATPYFKTGCWYVSISGRYQVPKLVRAMYANATVSLDRKQERANAILAADGPRKKPGPASRFTSEEEKREHFRKTGRERMRRYRAEKKQKAAASA